MIALGKRTIQGGAMMVVRQKKQHITLKVSSEVKGKPMDMDKEAKVRTRKQKENNETKHKAADLWR